MKKIVIIGANDFQKPLIEKAGEMGYETHVFAWREGATGAESADYFYEISITEKEEILKYCQEIRPDAVATIGSDLANITVQYLAEKLGLPGNSGECIRTSTNKAAMRAAFRAAGIETPGFWVVREGEVPSPDTMIPEPENSWKESVLNEGEIPVPDAYPVVVKPTDRSGSRAITKVLCKEELPEAIRAAAAQSFEKKAIVEEYISGVEYSVETISFQGAHTCLAITKKFTTGAPHYIEVGHLQPAPLSKELETKVKETVFHALDALHVENGAGHSELRIDENGQVRIIEIGSRMGGDCIGSDLVPLSCGQDFVGMVVDAAAGNAPHFTERTNKVSAIRFLMCEKDLCRLEWLKKEHSDKIRKVVLEEKMDFAHITDSSSRPGFYILQTDSMDEMDMLLHGGLMENPVKIFETPIQKLNITDGKNAFYMKRDDLLPFAFGGNKVRFAEKFVEDMKRKNCDSMIIYGNYHSNLCRILSTLCAQLDIPCYMVHNTEDIGEQEETANSRIIRRMGVHEVCCTKSGIADAVKRAMAELTEKGFRPYYIYGNARGEGNEWVPMQAYEEAYEEIVRQEKSLGVTFDYIFLASSTNATQSGLLAGSIHRGDDRKIVGISVSRNENRGKEVMEDNLAAYVEKFPSDKWPDVDKVKEKILFTDKWLEGGYGEYSEGIAQIIERLWRTDGIYLDMTYTGKGFYGMMNYLKDRGIEGKNILFLHTGGAPLFLDDIKTMRWEDAAHKEF